jgi:hypothetical protein
MDRRNIIDASSNSREKSMNTQANIIDNTIFIENIRENGRLDRKE